MLCCWQPAHWHSTHVMTKRTSLRLKERRTKNQEPDFDKNSIKMQFFTKKFVYIKKKQYFCSVK